MTDEHGAPLSAVLFVPRNAWSRRPPARSLAFCVSSFPDSCGQVLFFAFCIVFFLAVGCCWLVCRLQEGVKLVGFQIKLNVLLEVGEAIRSLRKKLSEPNKADTEAELHAFSIHLNRMQNVLASVRISHYFYFLFVFCISAAACRLI